MTREELNERISALREAYTRAFAASREYDAANEALTEALFQEITDAYDAVKVDTAKDGALKIAVQRASAKAEALFAFANQVRAQLVMDVLISRGLLGKESP